MQVWQNGKPIFDFENVVTHRHAYLVWGIGNYTDHVQGDKDKGTAQIDFDEAIVSTVPTHPFVEKLLESRRSPAK